MAIPRSTSRILRPDLSTVQETSISGAPQTPMTPKQRLLSKYSEQGQDDMSFGFSDGDSGNQLKPMAKLQYNQQQQQQQQQQQRPGSESSISSQQTPPASKYSESSASDHSDYGDDFYMEDNESNNKFDLVSNLQRHTQRQQKLAAEEIAQYRQYQKQLLHKKSNGLKYHSPLKYPVTQQPNYTKDVYDDDFDFHEHQQPETIFTRMERKNSLPMLPRVSRSGSPVKRLTKYASTLDLNRRRQSQTQFQPQPLEELDLIDDLDDLTITYKDYQKLKRKSQRRIDLSKYEEHDTKSHRNRNNHNNRHIKPHTGAGGNFDRLTREGKLKVITVMSKPNQRKVVNGHMYGQIVYDPDLMKWVGNDEELKRFQSLNAKPSLIKPNEQNSNQRVGNMIYDDQKLRWVSINGGYEDDPFDETIESPQIAALPRIQYNAPPLQAGLLKRSKIVPSSSSMSLSANLETQNFKVTTEMYKAWKLEEDRWVRKVKNWFNDYEDDGFENITNVRYELKSFLDMN